MRQQFSVDGPIEAMVKLGSGRLDVETAVDGAWASVEAVDPDHEPSVRLAERATIELRGTTLLVDVPESGRLFRRAEVAVTLGLPGGSSTGVKGGSVDVAVRGGLEDLSVKLGSGDIDVDVSTSISIKSGQSDVHVGHTEAIVFSTGQGTLNAESARDVAFKTGQGAVTVGRSRGSVAVKGGAVDLDIREAGPGDITFTTGSGSAAVGVATGTTVEMDLLSAAGDVRCDLPLESSAPPGGAGLRLKLRTGSGNLRVAPATTASV
jgi:hypothetical protein